MTKIQAGIVGAVIIAGVATPWLIHQQSKLRKENQSLRQEVQSMAGVRADNERLSNELARASSAQASAKDQLSELLRLRGQVADLRRQTNNLANLQAENQRLRSGFGQRTAAQATAARASLPKESWAFVGYADPEAAFQSTVWAMNQGDAKTYLASLTPDGPEFTESANKTEEEVASRIKAEFEKVTAFKILDKEIISDNEVWLTVNASGINESASFKLQRVGNEWKFDGTAKAVDATAAK